MFNLFLKVEQSLLSYKPCKESQSEKLIKAGEMGPCEGGGIPNMLSPLPATHMHVCLTAHTHARVRTPTETQALLGKQFFKVFSQSGNPPCKVSYYQVSIKPEREAHHRPPAEREAVMLAVCSAQRCNRSKVFSR